LRASVCYPYETTAVSKVCVLEDLLGKTRREGLCNPNEIKRVENSGAPVGVKNVEERVTGTDDIAITFVITHVGNEKDEVFKSDNSECDINKKTPGQTKISYTVSLGATDITNDCTGDGIASMYGDSGAQIRCTQKLTSRIDSEQTLTIKVNYNYLEYVDTPITVKQIGT